MFTNIPLIINLGESGPLTWDMAKQIIQSQHTLAIYGITAVVAVAAGLMFASWLWNLFLRRYELKKASESLKSEITARLDEDFSKLSGRNKDEIEKMEKKLEKTVEERTIQFDASAARLFVLMNRQMGEWENAVAWEATAIKNCAKSGDENMLRIIVETLNTDLEKCKKLRDKDKEAIKECLCAIPGILTKEKEQIEDKLKKLPEETTEQSETRPN